MNVHHEEPGSSVDGFPVVGVGIGSGGQAAFEAFLAGLPVDVDPGMAFILVQAADSGRTGLVSELIGRSTRLKAFEAEDGMVVEANCAYVIPPDCDAHILAGSLHLTRPSAPGGHRFPIDVLFRSLAKDRRERAACIVFPGTGCDGVMGLRAVRAAGGMVLGESPWTGSSDAALRSALGAGLVHPMASAPWSESSVRQVFVLLKGRTGHDFSLYRPGLMRRRIARRMAVLQVGDLEAYVGLLRTTPGEVGALFRDLLANSGGFFHASEGFEALESQVVPALVADRAPGDPIRIWCPGCSTGEEAYSIAMLLQERGAALRSAIEARIFATDVDSRAIVGARAGCYPAGVAADLSPGRLSRFFVPEDGGTAYRITRDVRDMVVFSVQDVVKDPPFSRLDLVSCLGLTECMSEALQRRLIPLFRYAVKPGGYLVLGSSGSVVGNDDGFTALDRGAGVFLRNDEGLMSFSGELAAATAELRRANEELQAVNEELQATNEELRTSKDELQSMVEEVARVNAELRTKMADLARVNHDMNVLLAGAGIATVFVDRRLRILRFSPTATRLINLIPADVGRPVGHIVSNLVGYASLVEDAQTVLDTSAPVELDVQTAIGGRYALRLQPYRTMDDVVDGVVMTFVEMS